MNWYFYRGPFNGYGRLRCERRRGLAVGLSAEKIEVGTHYEWEGDEKKWYQDTVYNLTIHCLVWKLELDFKKVKPVRQ